MEMMKIKICPLSIHFHPLRDLLFLNNNPKHDHLPLHHSTVITIVLMHPEGHLLLLPSPATQRPRIDLLVVLLVATTIIFNIITTMRVPHYPTTLPTAAIVLRMTIIGTRIIEADGLPFLLVLIPLLPLPHRLPAVTTPTISITQQTLAQILHLYDRE